MIQPMTFWQKVIAYSSLAFVLAWTVFGVFAIWVMLADKH
jgi:predicted DNA repair protein MutK